MATCAAFRLLALGSLAGAIRERRRWSKAGSASCDVTDSARRDCGFMGIDQAGCVARGCCWRESQIPGTPWCFNQGQGPVDPGQCTVSDRDKVDCGYSGINEGGCVARGCCWTASGISGVPWCFNKGSSGPTPTPTTAAPTPTSAPTPTPPPTPSVHRRQPVVYQISTRPWLYELAQRGLPANCTNNRGTNYVCLRDVPDSEWQKIKDDHADMVWLMGMWELGPESLGEAMKLFEDMKQWYGVPDLIPEDVIGSPYAPVDYRVNPEIGNDDDLAVVRAKLHSLDMGLMVDFVPNHFARDSKLFLEHPEAFVPRPNGDSSPNNWWYSKNGHTVAFGRGPYDGPWTDTLQINYWNPRAVELVSDLILSVARRADAIRLDMAHLVLNEVFQNSWADQMWRGGFSRPDTEFWSDAISRAKRETDVIFVSEAYDYYMTSPPEQELLTILGVDYSYNKQVLDKLEHFDLGKMREYLFAQSQGRLNRMCHFVENHDEPRAALALGGPGQSLAGSVAALTLPGMRLTYFGQYDGLKNRLGVHLRRAMPEGRDVALHVKYTRLMAALDHPVFHEGTWTMIGIPQSGTGWRLTAWRWEHNGEKRLVVFNWSDQQGWGGVQVADAYSRDGSDNIQLTDLLTGESFDRSASEMRGSGLFVGLAPWQAHLFTY